MPSCEYPSLCPAPMPRTQRGKWVGLGGHRKATGKEGRKVQAGVPWASSIGHPGKLSYLTQSPGVGESAGGGRSNLFMDGEIESPRWIGRPRLQSQHAAMPSPPALGLTE